MAGAMTVDGRIVRIDRPMPWVGRLLSLPLLAASFYLLWECRARPAAGFLRFWPARR
ncbi:hypothetical protein ACVWZ6_006139 [Bradyrhizobium sp. GM6.1]